mgnify:FL=1|jgi:aspartyl-tRNA(Asn)/glutamyl-tRNA(Gln) amidotransferase subunit C
MSVDKELVLKISKLSRISIEDDKIDSFIKSFSEILAYIDLLNSASENGLKIKEKRNVNYSIRDDELISKLPIDEVLKNAPRKDGNFFIVKKVIEED